MAIGTLAAFWAVSFLLVLVPGADWAYAIAAGQRDRSVLPAVAGLPAVPGVPAAVPQPRRGLAVRRPDRAAGPGAHRQLRRRLHQRGRHHRAGPAGAACRRHSGDPVLGSSDDRPRRSPSRRAPAHLAETADGRWARRCDRGRGRSSFGTRITAFTGHHAARFRGDALCTLSQDVSAETALRSGQRPERSSLVISQAAVLIAQVTAG